MPSASLAPSAALDLESPVSCGQWPQIQSSTPAVFSYGGLSELLGRSPLSLQADFSRKPLSLPPAHLPPGTKNPLWILPEVLQWLAAQPAKTLRPAPAALAVAQARRRGRPTKAEQIARERELARLAVEGGAA